jgi:hypothetical protein
MMDVVHMINPSSHGQELVSLHLVSLAHSSPQNRVATGFNYINPT